MSVGPSLSLCMIVKDEEAGIVSCLESVRGLVREMVVVDTGSADRTREVAEEAGARVFSFPWTGDFAAARNYGLARATGDWILVLDADEILAPVSPEALAALLEVPGVEGYFVHILSHLDDGGVARDQAVRLFRNRPVYRFTGAIHEQVAGAIKRHNNGGGLAVCGLVIHHYGYLGLRVREKDKRRRNISIIEKALADGGRDPFLLYSLGIEYFQADATEKGIAAMKKALGLMSGEEGYYREALIALGLGLMRAGRGEELSSFLDRARLVLPGDPDLHLLKALRESAAGRYAPAAEELRAALAGGARLLPPQRLKALLGDTYQGLGRYGEAEAEYLEALRLAPHELYPLTQILGLKQRGLSLIGWTDLGRFTSPAKKRGLREALLAQGEGPLGLVMALLAVTDSAAAGDTAGLAGDCRDYRRAVRQYGWRSEWGPVAEFLLPGAEEMLCWAEAAGRDGLVCPLFTPAEEIRGLSAAALELIVRAFCPPWAPAGYKLARG